VGAGEVFLELQDVVDVRAAPAINRLVRVAGHAQVLALQAKASRDQVLGVVGVLVLVHQDVAVLVFQLLADVGVVAQQVGRLDQQVVEIGGVLGGEDLLVGGVDRGDDPLLPAVRLGGIFGRADHLVLGLADGVEHVAGRELIAVAPERLDRLLHGGGLVRVVENRKAGLQAHVRAVDPQEPGAEGVERGAGDAPHPERRMRSPISLAALLVNVMARMCRAWVTVRAKCAARCVMTRVLPLPGRPARGADPRCGRRLRAEARSGVPEGRQAV